MKSSVRRTLFNRKWLLKAVLRLTGAIVLFIAFGLLAQTTYADDADAADPYQSQHGSIWLLADSGIYVESLALETDVDIDVSGMIARTRVKQRFQNNADLWAEGIYVFPLPDNAAVDHFSLRIGERVIEGRIQERLQARQTYEQARNNGRRAGLIEQQRPNVFTTSLANIEPGGEITLEFEYQQTLDYDADAYRLRFPMVVGPRFHSGDADADGDGIRTDVHTESADDGRTRNPTYIHVLLDAGVPLAKLNSSLNPIDIRQLNEHSYSLAAGPVPADRDFELSWSPELTDQPRATVLRERRDGMDYVLLTVLPPDMDMLGQVLPPREVIFILDISGSMQGASIEQAKAALLLALARLQPRDRFNLIWFNDTTASLYPNAVDAADDAIAHAKQVVGMLDAGGGTVMQSALEAALNAAHDDDGIRRVRQIIFLTDGDVDNEAGLFRLVSDRLGKSRLFTVGIGSAPNAWFMKKAARYGHGSYTFIGDLGEVQQKTTRLLSKLESPALVDIRLEPAATGIEQYPEPLPDLYLGEPLTVLLRAPRLPDTINISGHYGDSEWRQSVSMSNGTDHGGIRVAWAREKIAALMERQHDSRDEAERTDIRTDIIHTAIEHHLVSRYTSLVAVDVTPANNSGALTSQKLINNLPHGWVATDTGPAMMLAQTATDAPLHLLLALTLFVLATALHVFHRR
jgi:Ca-activated chloride channel family protein